ncbi:MAG TPA: DUF3300 domain-containing protein [Pyrinomonadaceae bacterium]|nr:DUF3300 domain-containing protein [Pyrinomonadaceae bacterium]
MQAGLDKRGFEKKVEWFAILILVGLSSMFTTALGQETGALPGGTVRETPVQLQQLVAPIALYPDELVAQILAASTYPTEIVEADRWLGTHSELQGERLAMQVDQQPWDSSIKALTAFPSVVANLDMNLSWTTALGDAYFNQQQDVLDAVQVMRQRAQAAGNLQSTPQQRVNSEGTTIVIEPAVPDTCYLPYYDPWLVYGAPLDVYPGYIYEPWYGPTFIAFGPAIGIGFFGRFGWGWPAWGFNWPRRVVVFNRIPFVSRRPIFFNSFRGGFRDGVRIGPRFDSFRGSRTFRGFGGTGFRGGGFRGFRGRR